MAYSKFWGFISFHFNYLHSKLPNHAASMIGKLIRPEDSCWTVRGRGQIKATIVSQAGPGGTKWEDRIGLQLLLLKEKRFVWILMKEQSWWETECKVSEAACWQSSPSLWGQSPGGSPRTISFQRASPPKHYITKGVIRTSQSSCEMCACLDSTDSVI